MKTSAAAWLALAGVLLALAACGDDDGAGAPGETISAEEAAYFEGLAPALQAVNDQLEDLDDLRADAFADGPNQPAADAYATAYETFATRRLAAIEVLAPSESVADEHAALVSAANDGVLLAADLRAELSESAPGSDTAFRELFGRLDGATIASRYLNACTTLQMRATSGGLNANLQCLL